MNLEICVLGPVEMWWDGRRVPLGTPKQLTLVAALVLAQGRPVPLGRLIERIWGSEPPRAAHSSLYTYVARLRRLLRTHCPGLAVIARTATSYALEVDPTRVDLHQARLVLAAARLATDNGRDADAVRLYRQALRLWQGEPLCGLRGSWAERTQAGLRQERLTALSGWFGAELRLGRHAEVLGELSAAVGEYPLDEVLAGLLMVSLHRSERHADALATFNRIRADLADQLGVDPGASLRRLHSQLLH
ncbi:AfsR/SARP family transcriptional regulator [Actinoplanes sp. NPDC089786]|uniref:AfsR/SARP family transcriptional regulator n=2 Tax=unclassified Actinoplanes TaxID=2626549 RepID=UPI00341D846E